MNQPDQKFKYRADIDGIRALAVTAVVLFHAGLGLPGGFVGVDVFFVISGFLITAIVVREIQQNRFTWFGFWERRVRRLFPAMAVAVTGTAILGWFLLLPHEFKELGQSIIAQSFALSNFFFWRESGYFAGPSEIKPLLHTWSLSVEEQFYLFLPGIALIAHRWIRNVIATLCVGFVLSLAFCIYQTKVSPDAAFFLLPARAWELLLGGIIALAGEWKWMKRGLAQALSTAGLAMVVSAFVLFDQSIEFPGSLALLPCLGTAMMIAGNQVEGGTFVGNLLSTRPVVFVGLISYSLYLWHWPLFAYANYLSPEDLPLGLALGLLAASFAMGTLSWRFVETPFRKKSSKKAGSTEARLSTAWMGWAAACIAVLVVAGGVIHGNNGFRNRFSESTLRFADARTDRNPKRKEHHDLSREELAKQPKLLVQGNTNLAPLVVIGDSHADALMPGIVQACEKHQRPLVAFTRSATIPLVYSKAKNKQAERFYERVREYLTSAQPKQILLIGRWTKYERLSSEAFAENFQQLHALNCDVIVGTAIPEPVADAPRFLALADAWGFDSSVIRRAKREFEQEQQFVAAMLQDAAEAIPNIHVVDLGSQFFDTADELGLIQLDGDSLYFDDNHLSTVGARFAVPALESQIALSAESIKNRSNETTDSIAEGTLR